MDKRAEFEERLRGLEGMTVAPWKPDHHLICLTYKGKEVGHFHGQDVLDLRLSPKIIREEGLTREITAQIHPDRSPNARWIGVRLGDVDEMTRLVARACEVR